MDYQTHPETYYGIEIRAGESVDDYIAKARHFRSTAAWIEYRDASPEQREDIIRSRDKNEDDEDRVRSFELLRITNNE